MKYSVKMIRTQQTTITVEAKSEKEALELASLEDIQYDDETDDDGQNWVPDKDSVERIEGDDA